MSTYLWVAIAVVVVVVVGLIVWSLVKRREPAEAVPAVLETVAPVAPPPAAETEPEAEAPTAEEAPAEAPALETPEQPASRMVRLRRRLASSRNGLARALGDLLAADKLDAATWDAFETTLLSADLGVGPTTELVDGLRAKLGVEGTSDPVVARQALHDDLLALVDPTLDRSLNLAHAAGVPAVVMMVGVNGTGKTTTVGKLGRLLVAEGQTVLFGAADTFRAAAAQQLTTWGERVGVETVSGAEGADPASVAYQAVERGVKDGVDVVLVDTAGRLHTKVGLMDELGKVKRVIEKLAPVTEVLLVVDATTGQNGLAQARIFAEVVDVTGLVLTKLDGSAKGGIVVAVQRELNVPVKLVGLGEGVDDLAPFDPEQFVQGLLGE